MATVERYTPLFRAVEVACDAPDFDGMPSSPGTHAKAPPPVTLLLQWMEWPGWKVRAFFSEAVLKVAEARRGGKYTQPALLVDDQMWTEAGHRNQLGLSLGMAGL